MAPLWQTGPFPVIKGQTHSSIKSLDLHTMLATQSILSNQYCITLAVTDRQTHNTYICVLFFSLLFLPTNNISTLCTRPTYGNTLDLMRCPPPPTVSFKLLQYILLLYLREIHYLGKLCILVQGFLLCRNEHKHKINERVWALNWSWIVKKFVFSLYLFSFAVNLCTSTMLLVLWVCLVVEI